MARPVATQVDLEFALDEAGTFVIDIPRCLSLINRKSFRSGYVYSLDYLEFIGSVNDIIEINKIPEGYVTNQSWKLGFNVWREQRSAAMKNTGTQPGKWADFKCWMSFRHQDGGHMELLPEGVTLAGTSLGNLDITGAEWNRADLVINDGGATTDTTAVGMLGQDVVVGGNLVYGGLIQAWGNTRSGTVAPDPNQPGTLSTSWISMTGEASEAMSQDVLDLVEDENDHPPYANEINPLATPTYVGGSQSAPGGLTHDTGLAGATGRAVGLSGGLFPLGLIQIATAGADNARLRLHVTRGEYKGVAAMKIGDFA